MILGIGVDVVEIARIERAVERYGERFLERVFSPGERDYSWSNEFPAPHLAARFAAKEAAMKVLGTGWARGVRWRDIELVRFEAQAPRLVLSGRALALSQARGITRWHVSVSHSGGVALAFVVGEGCRAGAHERGRGAGEE